jgi:hypothetical protein
MQVLIPVANGSGAIEVVTIADILGRAKVDVIIASVENLWRFWHLKAQKLLLIC